MNSPHVRFALAAILAVTPTLARASDAPPANHDVTALAWLAGCFASQAPEDEPGSGEQWTAPAGGTMLGVSRTVRGGKTVSHEFVVIQNLPSGTLAYVAHPSGQAANAFPLRSIGEREVVFEDLDHDFPQRVIYRLGANGALAARVEGARDGAPRGIDFSYRRVDCEGWGARP